jgi:hypothetical protein
MTAFQESGSTAEILVWAQQAKTALEGSAQKVRNDQQLKLSWSAFDHSTQSSLTASSTAQLIKDLSTTQHVTFDTSLFKGADLDALVDYKALLALDKRYLTEPNTSPVADDHCVGQIYKPDHDGSKLLIIDWGGKSRIMLPESLIAHFCKSAHDPEDHLKVDRTAQFLNWCLWPLLLIKTLKSSLLAMMRYDPQLDWKLALPIVVSAINCSTHAATKISPYNYIFGRDSSFNGISLDSAAVADTNWPFRALPPSILKFDVDSKPQLVHRHLVVEAKIRPAHLDKDAHDLLDNPDSAFAGPSPSSAAPPSPAPAMTPSPAPPREVPHKSGRQRRQPDRYGTSS